MLYRIPFFLLFFSLLITSGATDTWASRADMRVLQQGAEQFMRDVESIFVHEEKANSPVNLTTNLSAEWNGEPMIEKVGDYYAITLPHLRLNAKDEAKYMVIDIGMIAINAMKLKDTRNTKIPNLGRQDVWSMSVAFPSTWLIHEKKTAADGTEKMEITGHIQIDTQNTKKLWLPKHEVMALSQMEFSIDVFYVETGMMPIISIPKIVVSSRMGADDDSKTPLWSGATLIKLHDILFQWPDEQDNTKMHSIATIKSLDFLQEFNGMDKKHLQRHQYVPTPPAAILSDDDLIVDKVSSATTISDIDYKDHKYRGLKIAKLTFSNSTTFNPETKRHDNRIGLRKHGLEFTGELPESDKLQGFTAHISKDFIPKNIEIDIELKNLPNAQEIMQAKQLIASKDSQEPETMLRFGGRQMRSQAFAMAGTQAHIHKILLQTGMVSMDMKGVLNLVLKDSEPLANGTIEIGLTDLAKIIHERLNKPRSKEQNPEQPDMMLMIFGILEQLGIADDKNPDRKRYLLEINPDGTTTLNGIDLSNLNSIIPQGQPQ